MNRTGRGLVGVRLGNGVSNKDCGMEVDINGEAVSTSDVPLESGNAKYVSDSSLYTFKHLEKVNHEMQNMFPIFRLYTQTLNILIKVGKLYNR